MPLLSKSSNAFWPRHLWKDAWIFLLMLFVCLFAGLFICRVNLDLRIKSKCVPCLWYWDFKVFCAHLVYRDYFLLVFTVELIIALTMPSLVFCPHNILVLFIVVTWIYSVLYLAMPLFHLIRFFAMFMFSFRFVLNFVEGLVRSLFICSVSFPICLFCSWLRHRFGLFRLLFCLKCVLFDFFWVLFLFVYLWVISGFCVLYSQFGFLVVANCFVISLWFLSCFPTFRFMICPLLYP